MGQGLQSFLPRLLPARKNHPILNCHHTLWFSLPSLIPLVVVTIASLVYFRYGRSVQYEEYLVQARNAQRRRHWPE